MAITGERLKFQVQILVDGVALPEYENNDHESATIGPVTKFVEAKSGADF
jgi:hypothetical protein